MGAEGIIELCRFPITTIRIFWAFAAENENLPAWKYLAGKKSPGIVHTGHLCPSTGLIVATRIWRKAPPYRAPCIAGRRVIRITRGLFGLMGENRTVREQQ